MVIDHQTCSFSCIVTCSCCCCCLEIEVEVHASAALVLSWNGLLDNIGVLGTGVTGNIRETANDGDALATSGMDIFSHGEGASELLCLLTTSFAH